LSSSASTPPLAVSGLIGESDLQSRVHRLLDLSISARRHPAVWLPTVALLAAAVVGQSAPVLAAVHELFELLVNH
jgi:hypothetical protein